MLLSFEPLQEGLGLEIVDHIERRKCFVQTSGPVEPKDASVDQFQFPVDQGVSIRAKALTLPHRMAVPIRNALGVQVRELTKGDSCKLPKDQYTIELTAPVKLYLVVESELAVDVRAKEVRFDFGESVEVNLGARSYHKNPAATITTTSNPEDMMAAVSLMGSALKSTTPERSYPTLRGHPPAIELGERLDIPDILNIPETGVTIEIPREHQHVFVIAPLAYYLGAKVIPGPVPKLSTVSGFEHVLDNPARGFEGEVERVLKQTFFMDCLTRTEGFYPVNLHERNNLDSEIDFDFEELYNASLGEQLEAYLSVQYGLIEDEIPEWKLTAHVSMTPENIEILPFVVNDLAVVRSPSGQHLGNTANAVAVNDYSRSGDFTRGAATGDRATAESAPSPSLIKPEQTDSLEQAWVGEGAPVGASKAMVEAFRNRLNREPTEGDIDIMVICNDSAMNSERNIVDDIYGSRDDLSFQISDHHELMVDELREVLKQECDFLHYIGHIDERGFECQDGYLDISTLESTGVQSFLLNACTSYQQGMELIRAGSIAGVVTVEDVINSGAETIGSSLAKLLNHGFPFRAALSIAKEQSIVGGHYLVLGDGGIDIAQSESGVPAMCQLSVENSLLLTYHTYPTYDKGQGCITIPHVSDNNEYYLAGGETGRFNLELEELAEFVSVQPVPVQLNGKLHWSDEIRVADLFDN